MKDPSQVKVLIDAVWVEVARKVPWSCPVLEDEGLSGMLGEGQAMCGHINPTSVCFSLCSPFLLELL